MRLRQPARGYRLTSDAVLLAALAPLRADIKVLELGTGYGQVLLCVLAREPSAQVTGLEKMPQAAALARENAKLNKVEDRFTVIEGNIASAQLSKFDLVLANPPYRQAHTHTASDDPVKAAATTEVEPLALWCKAAAQALTADGAALFIHDARREDDVLAGFTAAGLGRLCVLPLASKAGLEPNRIVVRARHGQGISKLSPLVLHEDDGRWRPEIDAVLRAPLALPLWPD